MAEAPASVQTPLSRRGIERLDLMLLCAEALDLNGGEAMVWLSEEMGFTDLFPNRVELWKRRCSNPLRRNTRRASLKPEETDALIRILTALSERLYPMLRTLLSSAEPADLNAQRWDLFRARLRELVLERLNPRRGGVQRLLDPEQGPALSRELVQARGVAAGGEAPSEALGEVFEESLDEIYVFDARTLRYGHVNRRARGNVGFVAAGFEPEKRGFRSHLTLGRVRGRELPDVAGVAPPPPTPFEVAEAVLFRSDLGPRGAKYTPLERIALGGIVHPDTQEKER